MKNILWAQSKDSLEKDTFIIDEICTQESGSAEEIDAFHQLTLASKNLAISPRKIEKLKKKGLSRQSNYAINDTGCYIQGCFSEKDNKDRTLPYRFLSIGCRSFDEALLILKKYAYLISRECNSSDLEILKHHASKKKINC